MNKKEEEKKVNVSVEKQGQGNNNKTQPMERGRAISQGNPGRNPPPKKGTGKGGKDDCIIY